MRSVLVCVRTAAAAQRITAYAARLGVANALRTALSGEDALARLSERPADVVLVDTAMARPDCVHFTRRLLSRSPQAAVVLVGAEDPRVAAAAVAAGARGVIRTGEHGDDLVTALTRGILMICPNGAPVVPIQRDTGGNHRVVLTERELQVLRGMSEGCSNAEIGRQLFVSEDTVKTHARRLFRKLGARDRAHAVAAAFRAGLVS
ncbi:MAG: response regulator transcription factor [Micromonosporaceae bacterium]